MLWVAIVELPFALAGMWLAWMFLQYHAEQVKAGYKESKCEREGDHALKATRWYSCRACGYEASFEEASRELAKENTNGAQFVILKSHGEKRVVASDLEGKR